MSGAGVTSTAIDRPSLVDWFVRTRARSRQLFDMLHPDAYHARPIALRHPIVFYEGHLAAFGVNTLVKKALGLPGIDPEMETLFARGIDPENKKQAGKKTIELWPPREKVRAFAEAADQAIVDALLHAEIDRPGDPMLDRAQAVFTIIEHEAMHQETLLYMWHRLPYDQKIAPAGYQTYLSGEIPKRELVTILSGQVTLGANRGDLPFGWDNEFPAMVVDVPAFSIDKNKVSNGEFLEFVWAGAYQDDRWWTPADWKWRVSENVRQPLFWDPHPDGWLWHGLFEQIPLPLSWPAYVSHAEASAFARWRSKRLPTEAEFHRAAYGTPSGEERPFPWGSEPFDRSRGNADFDRWDPVPGGSRPAGRSAWGIQDLVGNGWEWTSTIFSGFPGFAPMASYPEYSADFFDRRHFVMKGGSPATARELLRRSFRNWFRPHYPYVYAGFRCIPC